MPSTLIVKLDDDTFFELKELKARLKAKTWKRFIKKIIKLHEKKQKPDEGK